MTDTRMIPVRAISDDDRLRPIDEAWVTVLAESIRDHGLEMPITVRPNPEVPADRAQLAEMVATDAYLIVAGSHRLAAFRRLGLTEISAIVRDLSADEARIVEIDENLMRRELDPLDRAVFLAQRKAAWERLHPETRHGGSRKSRATQGENQVVTMTTRFSKDVARRTGLSEETVRRACRIYDELGPDAIAKLRRTALAGNQAQLLLLARMEPADRIAAIDAAVVTTAPTVKAALRSVGLGGATPPQEEVLYRKLVDLWSRSSAKTRKRFLAYVGVEEG